MRRRRFRYLRRTTIALLSGAALALLILLGLWNLFQSPAVCRRVAKQIEGGAKTLVGIDLKIGSLSWSLLPPGMILEDFSIHTQSLSVDCSRLQVGLGAFRVSRRTLVLSSLAAEKVHISLSQTAGTAPSSAKSPPIRVIVEKLSLRKISFEGALKGADLDIEDGEVGWFREAASTTGYFRLANCRFRGGGLNEIRSGVEGSFVEEAGRLRFRSLKLEGEGLKLRASGEVSREGAAAHLAGRVDIPQLDRMIRAHGLLTGAHLDLEGEINSSAKDFVRLKVKTPEIVVSHRFPLKFLRGELGLSRRALWGRVDEASFFGGHFHGNYRLGALGGSFPHDVQAHCEGMDLGAFLGALKVPTGGLSAGMNVGAELQWKGRKFPRGSGRAEIQFFPRQGALPVEGSLSLGLDGGAFLEFQAQDLHLGRSRVDLQGPLQIGSWDPAWSIHAEPALMDEILPAVNRWVGSRIFPAAIGGQGLLDLSMNGPWKELRVAVHLDAHNLSWPPISLDRADLDARIGSGGVDIRHGHFSVGDGGGRVEGAIRWKPAEGEEELQLQINGRDLPMNKVMSWAGSEPGLWSGALSFSGGLRGNLAAPSGSWALSAREMTAGGLKCGSGGAFVELEDGVFRARQLDFDRGLEGDLAWKVVGQHFWADLGWKQMELDGNSLLGKVFGGKAIDWQAKIDWKLREALPEGRIKLENQFSRLEGELSDEGLLLQGKLRDALAARVEIPDFDAHRPWSGTGELRTEKLSDIFGYLGGPKELGLKGRMRFGLKLQGVGTALQNFEARNEEMEVSFDEKAISILEGGVLSWSPEGFLLSSTKLSAGKDEVEIGGRVDPSGALKAQLSGSFDARVLGFFLPEWEPAGSVSGSVQVFGRLGAPYFEGSARLGKASFRLPQTSLILSDVGGDLLFSRARVVLDGMSFRILRGRGRGGGMVQLSGDVPLFALSGTIQGLQYPLFEGLTPRISGSWSLGGPVGQFILGGELSIDSAELRSKKDLPSLLLDWFGEEEHRESSGGLQLDLHVKGERSLLSRSPLIRLAGSTDLHIIGDATAPGLLGQITFDDGGEITVQGVRYEVEHAHLGFADPNSIETMVNIGLEARIQDYQVRVQLNGSAEHLVPVVSSEPPLSPQEIFSLMSVGSPTADVGAGGAIGLSVASSMLSNSLQNALENRDLWLLPIDQVRIDPFVENATGDPSARVTVVKQLSQNFTVTLQSDISAEKNQVITGRWYLGSGLFIEGSRDQNRQVGIDFKMRKRY